MALNRHVNRVDTWKLSFCKPTNFSIKYMSLWGVRLGDRKRAYPAYRPAAFQVAPIAPPYQSPRQHKANDHPNLHPSKYATASRSV